MITRTWHGVPEYYRQEVVGLPGVVFTRICPSVYQAEHINCDELIQLQCECTVLSVTSYICNFLYLTQFNFTLLLRNTFTKAVNLKVIWKVIGWLTPVRCNTKWSLPSVSTRIVGFSSVEPRVNMKTSLFRINFYIGNMEETLQ